ncbi:MAG: LemA family protein [Rubrivivax sp.]|nr:LemA family protein [Rubrivivax sp.]
MNGFAWTALGIVAVLGFWVLGAYNRLVSLRNAVAAAWAQADEAQRRRGEGTEQLVAALRAPLADERGALDALWSAQAASARAAGAMSARPLVAANALAWAEAERHLGAAAARVFALAEGQAEALAGNTAVAEARAAWAEGEQRLRFARQLYNDAAAVHDEAVAVFPTSLLSPAFGFPAAGRL